MTCSLPQYWTGAGHREEALFIPERPRGTLKHCQSTEQAHPFLRQQPLFLLNPERAQHLCIRFLRLVVTRVTHDAPPYGPEGRRPKAVLAGRLSLWGFRSSFRWGRRPRSSHHSGLLLPSSWLLLLCLICLPLTRTSASLRQCPHLKLVKHISDVRLPCQVTLAVPG